jgi:hypothetical protein
LQIPIFRNLNTLNLRPILYWNSDATEPFRSLASLAVLAALLQKTEWQTFAQLVTIVRSHVNVTDLTDAIDGYASGIVEEISLWPDFVSDSDPSRAIKRNSGGLLATEAVAQGEAQKRAIGKARAEIDRLEKDNADLQIALGSFNSIMRASQEQLVRKEAAIAELSRQLKNLKGKPLDG